MSLRSQLALAALSILATAALAVTAADARPGQGRGHQPQNSAPLLEDVMPEVETPAIGVETPEISIESSIAEQLPAGELAIENPIVDESADLENLPPGLQRQVDSGRGLPPGLQRQADSDRGLPPGLQNR